MGNVCLECGFDGIEAIDNYCRKCGRELDYEKKEQKSAINYANAKIKAGHRIDDWYVIGNDYFDGRIVCLLVKTVMFGQLKVRIIDEDNNLVMDDAKIGFKELCTLRKIDKI